MTDTIEIRQNDPEDRFEIWVDGALAGELVHDGIGPVVKFLHTKVDDQYGGRGLGSTLIKSALDAMREQGHAVVPYCPFVKAYIQKHPDYLDLVPESIRTTVGLPREAPAS